MLPKCRCKYTVSQFKILHSAEYFYCNFGIVTKQRELRFVCFYWDNVVQLSTLYYILSPYSYLCHLCVE
jgi:hypothetical protein